MVYLGITLPPPNTMFPIITLFARSAAPGLSQKKQLQLPLPWEQLKHHSMYVWEESLPGTAKGSFTASSMFYQK